MPPTWHKSIPPPPMEWQREGLCHNMEGGLFDDLERYPGKAERKRLDKAFAFCQVCPVKQKCLDFGVESKGWGIFGGLLLRRGKAVALIPLFDRKRRSRTLAARRAREAQRKAAEARVQYPA